ncbi:hypothetical protein ILUMI_03322 [Ignelater luminosus]|uniref:Uncharacterized protein n=1 Tax=Ignelater luminosus TaxID=2038154 RepID=A0A8K0GK18_IGNLU|nr:hypothetical protein ILUMI_03322 [Ignelater luminosus]
MDKFVSECMPPTKRPRLDSVSGEDKKVTYRRVFYEVLDIIILNIIQRFAEISTLKFLGLLDQFQFDTFANNFPEKAFLALKEHYGDFSDLIRLKSELSVVYKDPDMKINSILELHDYITFS